ncbi:hypothetical protein JKF63_01256 [Porcisia hertigi]|uniref:Uncharacterized protein n=1 Tax=Porcisia hertigi TaxID=2761500 RepID=A0A836HUD2_9TRYP|nr:hypothetical protein JKF63_01256 [Porcisia hertigi]
MMSTSSALPLCRVVVQMGLRGSLQTDSGQYVVVENGVLRHAKKVEDDGRHETCTFLARGAGEKQNRLPLSIGAKVIVRQQLQHPRELVTVGVDTTAARGVHKASRIMRYV